MTITIYHNPKCSKSRATLALLHEQGIKPEIIEYLKTPPTGEELKRILSLLGKKPADILRSKEAKEEGVDPKVLNDDALVDRMVATPGIIERPIVIANGKAILGRPPENVLEIL